ncbi:ABC transporter permease subunit [Pontiella agarivorans]|uniref:ABC transporter permease subunit n=1 Tax=Pontiella agarivorans TaxID=3038953 RepID=A0ABU5MZR1_9BACT|nr:ABC transporter permease subunit [Pontiella agarivorans]MDZ8119581.1 ABC transporter permease subunit [Pontiella agarivorans]
MNEAASHILAVAKREWRAYFDSPVAYVFIIIFLMLAGFFTFSLAQFYEAGQADLNGFFQWHPWLYMILVPAVAMRLWAEERRSGTIELLFTVSVTPLQALLGKFLAAWLFMLLALLLTFPVPMTAAYLGSPDGGTIVSGYIGSGLLAGAYVAAGIFTSALTRNQVISFILAVVIGLFLILAGYPPVTDLLSRWAPTWMVDGVASFSFMTHYETLQRGVIDLRDLIYFASVMIFMLFTTQVVLKSKVGR